MEIYGHFYHCNVNPNLWGYRAQWDNTMHILECDWGDAAQEPLANLF